MTNSKRLGGVLLAALVVAGVGTPARAADVTAGADVYSAYIWRGITLGGTPVIQPWVDVSGIKLGEKVSFGFNVWSNAALSDWTAADKTLLTEGSRFNEFDVTLSLTLPKGFKAGYIEYSYPYTLGTPYLATRELYGSWAHSGIVNVGLNLNYDVGLVDDYYLSATVGKSLTINDKTSVSVDGLVGLAGEDFAKAYYGTKGGLYNYNLSAKLSYKATEKMGLGAVVGYAGSIDTDVLPEQDKKFYVGANFSVGF